MKTVASGEAKKVCQECRGWRTSMVSAYPSGIQKNNVVNVREENKHLVPATKVLRKILRPVQRQDGNWRDRTNADLKETKASLAQPFGENGWRPVGRWNDAVEATEQDRTEEGQGILFQTLRLMLGKQVSDTLKSHYHS